MLITRILPIWILLDGSKEQVLLAKAAMEPVAVPYFEQHKNEDDSAMFFYTDPSQEDTGLCPIDYLSLPSTRPLLLLVHNLQMCMYVCEATELNERSVKEFFAGYQAGTLKKTPLKWTAPVVIAQPPVYGVPTIVVDREVFFFSLLQL